MEVEPGVEVKINAAYAYGDVQQAREVVESVTGIAVDNYAVVDFGGFRDTIDAMGGVEMDVEDETPQVRDKGWAADLERCPRPSIHPSAWK